MDGERVIRSCILPCMLRIRADAEDHRHFIKAGGGSGVQIWCDGGFFLACEDWRMGGGGVEGVRGRVQRLVPARALFYFYF